MVIQGPCISFLQDPSGYPRFSEPRHETKSEIFYRIVSKKVLLCRRYDNFCGPHDTLVVLSVRICLPKHRVRAIAPVRHLVRL